MTPLLLGITGLISTAKKHFTNPLTEARDWSDYDSPALERRSGISLDKWHKTKFNNSPAKRSRPRGSLDQLI